MMLKSTAVSTTIKTPRMKRMLRDLVKNRQLYLLILVPLTLILIFKYWPMYGVQIAFRNFRITKSIADSSWVGLKYFQKFFNNPLAFTYIFNTLAISLYELCLFPLSLILALMLNYITSRRFKRTVQMVSYAPHFISVVVMCGLLIQFLQARIGLVNVLLNTVGIEGKNWLTYPTAFRDIYVWSEVWQHLGYGSIIYIASLSSVSPELHEAAIVDGASIIKRIWYVDIPSILPTFSILLIMRIGRIMDVGFQKVLLLQNNLNLSASEIISTYVYNIGLNSTGAMPQYSYGAAIGLLTAVVNLVLLVIVNRVTRKLSGTGLW